MHVTTRNGDGNHGPGPGEYKTAGVTRSNRRTWWAARALRGGLGLFTAIAAVLAAQPAASANPPPVLNWTYQHPATNPPDRAGASMAYDRATGTVVLFGGEDRYSFGDTWTWDGSTWTKQHPATSPSARELASMAYDAATGTVVLFGGIGHRLFDDTWTWNGTTWTKQAPATHPSPRRLASMAYDTATGTDVLFGGYNTFDPPSALNDTWTWDGTTWTKQSPATRPPRQGGVVIASDAASGTVVLWIYGASDDQTWTWG